MTLIKVMQSTKNGDKNVLEKIMYLIGSQDLNLSDS